MKDDDALFMSADEAAAALGVSLTTLYAYVGRKGIRSEKQAGSKSRRYWRADVEKARTRGGPPPPPTGGLVASTRITLLTPNGPFYRGICAVDLAETATLEETAALLWNAESAFEGPAPSLPAEYAAANQALAGLPRYARAIPLLSLIEQGNPRAHDLSTEGYARAGAGVIRCFAGIVAGAPPSREPIHDMLAKALGVPDHADLIRRSAVLAADHELDPTTYAVRAAANTGITPYGAAMAGLVAGRGRRLSLGRSELVARFVEEVLNDDPKEAVLSRFRTGEAIPGFGRYAYGDRDPRAEALLAALYDQAPKPAIDRLRTTVALAEDLAGAHPDFIVPAIFLGRLLGLKGEELAVSTIGRMVGWIAHAMEQFHDSELFRPRTTYSGPLPGSR